MDGGSIHNVLEVNAASVFTVEGVGCVSLCVYRFWFSRVSEERRVEACAHCKSIGTMDREGYQMATKYTIPHFASLPFLLQPSLGQERTPLLPSTQLNPQQRR